MAVPAVPGPGLAVIEAEVVLGPLEAFLDGPAQAGGTSQLGEARGDGAENQKIGASCQIGEGVYRLI